MQQDRGTRRMDAIPNRSGEEVVTGLMMVMARALSSVKNGMIKREVWVAVCIEQRQKYVEAYNEMVSPTSACVSRSHLLLPGESWFELKATSKNAAGKNLLEEIHRLQYPCAGGNDGCPCWFGSPTIMYTKSLHRSDWVFKVRQQHLSCQSVIWKEP